MLNGEERIPYQWECFFFNVNTFTKDVERILYEGERFLCLHERILFRYFLENFSLGIFIYQSSHKKLKKRAT